MYILDTRSLDTLRKDCLKLVNNKVVVAQEDWNLRKDKESSEQQEIANLCLVADDESSPPKSEVNSHQFPSTSYYNEHDNVLEEEYNKQYVKQYIS